MMKLVLLPFPIFPFGGESILRVNARRFRSTNLFQRRTHLADIVVHLHQDGLLCCFSWSRTCLTVILADCKLFRARCFPTESRHHTVGIKGVIAARQTISGTLKVALFALWP